VCLNAESLTLSNHSSHRVQLAIQLVLLIATFLMLPTAYAQVSGQFYGVVTDLAGATVAGAKVTLQNTATGLERETATDGNGNYEILAVPVGTGYSVTAVGAGFKTSEQTGFRLEVNQRYRVDFKLEVGAVAQTVNVTGSPVEVESSSTQLGDVIEDRKIVALPLNGRSYLDLLGLQPGVAPVGNPSPFQPTVAVSGDLTSGELSVNGQRENANSFMVNGAIAEDNGSNGAGVIPVLDSIQEFRLLTSTFDPEYGNFSGAVVNVITKAGTNEFHGSVFEFLRNTDLDAKTYFNSTRGTLIRNQFGGSIGGPAIKNHLFFFGDYQGTRQTKGLSTGNLLVPSDAQKTGDLSTPVAALLATLAQSGGPLPTVRGDNGPGHMAATLTSRLGYAVTPGEPYFAPGCTGPTQCVFPGGIVPQSAWSSAAAGLLKFFPTSNGAGDGTFPSYSSAAANQIIRDDKWAARVDIPTGNGNDTWSVYYHFDSAAVTAPLGAPNTYGTATNVPGFSYTQPSHAQIALISNTKVFSPTKVNEAHLSYYRITAPGLTPVQGLGKVSSFGFVEGGLGLIPSNVPIEGVPDVILNGLGLTLGAAASDGSFQNVYQVQDGYSWIVGKHTIKMGGEFSYKQWNRRASPVGNGQFVFSGGESGIDFADYLIGAPDQFIQSSLSRLDARSKAGALYVQDNFKLRPNLTINFGIRWEVAMPWYDAGGKIQAFIPGQQSSVFTNSPTGWVFPGDKGIPKTLGPVRWNNFAPRLGLAYSPAPQNEFLQKILGAPGKSSIRAAVGQFFTTLDVTGGDFETGDAPFGLYYSSPSLVYLETPFKGRSTGVDPGQRFPFIKPAQDESFQAFQPIALSPAYFTGNKTPYAVEYNLTLQRELGSSTLFTLGYVGALDRHLFQIQEFNPGNPQTCLAIAQVYAAANQPGGCGPGGADTIYSLNGQTFNGTRPYSVTSGKYLSLGELDFGDNPYSKANGVSSYNSLQVSVDKRVGPERFLAAYTWAKSLDDASTYTESVNPYNAGLSYGLSTFDIRNNFVVSYSWDMPLGHWLSSPGGLSGKLLNGWQLIGIARFTGGFPILLQETDDRSLCSCDGQGIHSLDLPNYNGQHIKKFNPRNNAGQYFDTSVFSQMTLGVPGNAKRSFFNGPGINNFNTALHKVTPITERVSLEFRAEFFNTFNHAQFLSPVGNYVASNFGQVTSANDGRIGQGAVRILF
jgi:Carboxypeptidase regulatory-like domain